MRKDVAIGSFVLILAFALAQCGGNSSEEDNPQSKNTNGQNADEVDRSIPDNVPRIRIALTGSMLGKLEPCGCAEAQLGGLPRRMFHLGQHEPFDLRIEGGDIVKEASALDALKLLTALETLFAMGDERTRYDILAIGPNDLTMADQDYLTFTAGLGAPLLSSDVERTAALEEGSVFDVPKHREYEFRGVKVRVASLAMKAKAAAADRYRVLPSQESWTAALDGAAPETLRVLLVHGTNKQVREMANLEPRPDLVVGINPSYTEPPVKPDYVDGVPVVFPGSEGRCVLEVSLARLEDGPRLGYNVKELRGSETDRSAYQDAGTRGILLQHRLTAAESGVLEAMAERFPTKNGARYVGSLACKSCHEEDYAIWEKSKHAGTWDLLENVKFSENRYPWDTTKYPDCVGCHVVGYGQESGFVNPEKTPALRGVGCEECHGAGSAHVEDPKQFKLGSVSPVKCLQCHDHDQTPDFDYGTRWPQIRHGQR